MTPFQIAQQQVIAGTLKTPSVNANGREIGYFNYQLAVHHFNIKLMANGMKFKNIRFTDIKKYYGLKGRSAADCLPQFEAIMEEYKSQATKN